MASSGCLAKPEDGESAVNEAGSKLQIAARVSVRHDKE
jgi:hypothetical protein